MQDLNEKLKTVQVEHVEGQIAESQEEMARKRYDRALVMTGEIKAANGIERSLQKQKIKALQAFRDGKEFEALGFTRFDDYLNNFEYSPMTYRQFNEQEKLLLKEGDDLFQAFTLAGMPISKRLLLGKGDVVIDGDTVIVTHQTVKYKKDSAGKDVENVESHEERIPVADREGLLQAITALTERTNKQSKKLADQKRRLKAGEEDFDKLKRAKSVKAVRDEIDEACGVAVAALGDLDRLITGADPGRVGWFIKNNYPYLAARYALLSSTLTEKLPGVNLAAAVAIEEADATAALLEDDED